MIEAAELVALPIFAGFPPEILARTAAKAADVRVNAGEYLVHEGESPAFYVLLSGVCEVVKRVGRQERVLIERSKPGEYFGELPLLVGSSALASFRAKTDARLARLEPQEFQWLVIKMPSFGEAMQRTIEERIRGVRDAVTEMPLTVAIVLGKSFDRACHDVRDFLARNHVPYAFFEMDDPFATKCVHDLETISDRCPIVKIVETGAVFVEPTMSELASAVGLQTSAHGLTYDVAIVGGGPGGLAAAVYGASEGLRTVLLEGEAPGGQTGTSSRIENYLGFPNGVSGDELARRAVEQATRFGAELVITHRVTGIEVGEASHALTLDDGSTIRARSVVLATGVSWRRLDVDGCESYVGAGVFYGAARTEAASTRGCDIYLVGAGNSAGQAAMFFSDYARSVTLVVRGASLEKGMSNYLIRELRTRSNICVELSSEIVGMRGEGRLSAITLRDRRTNETENRDTNFVFVFIGADAETGWLPGEIARDERGYIVTGLRLSGCDLVRPWPLERDPFSLETSVPGIFAAGDVRAGSVKRCASAVGEGSMAIAFAHQHFDVQANAIDKVLN